MVKTKRSLVTLLVFVMCVSLLAACGSKGNDPKTTPTPAPKTSNEGTDVVEPVTRDEITIDIFSMLSNFSGEQTGWFAHVVKEKFNININIIASNLEGGGDTKFQTMMAGGDLGDLVVFGDTDAKYTDAIAAGMLLDWNKDGLVDQYGKNLLQNAPKALEKNTAQFGGGTAIYGVGNDVGPDTAGPSEAQELNYHPNLRWDLYEAIGKPAIKTMEDYLPVLKAMQEAQPESDSGKPTYAFSMWGDWDGNMMMNTKAWAGMHGFEEGDGFNPGGFTLVSADTEEVQSILDENSYYMRGLKLYFDANQMGLVDPDSITQNFGDAVNKMTDGQVLFSWFSWFDDAYNTPERTAEGKGFHLVPFDEARSFSYGFNPYGGNRVYAIGSKTEHPDRVMELIDWLYTPEGTLTANYGPEGMAWELVDGKPVLTALGLEAFPSNKTAIPAEFGGGVWDDGRNQINNTTFKTSMINPENGDPYDYSLWTSTLAKAPTKLDENWRAAMGANTAVEWFVKNNKIAVQKAIFTGKPYVEMSDDLKQKQGQVAAVIKEYSWKLIYANDQAQFDKLKEEMINKAKGLGYDEVVAFNKEQHKVVFEARKSS
ncbi:ABC transporter substrate-binding protein [Paenibacillus endoradicis]|uniref:ABC transporter substrate-binding protein n=1 Tax=Paenibacillus endoradicis TaxID=2972487 RepID=UPI002158DB23|nr:ABC transporter substrate-binding protein [Paenibacillus endoradicis]MCR8655811.1 ABC transporter substrate-binding protein [Paenibacillus endoradicis]MCR8658137.1 ABC transporter substrate-binding protein [Paenibacillus endoradicis]